MLPKVKAAFEGKATNHPFVKDLLKKARKNAKKYD
jgi:hypothetical protein